MFDLEVFPAKDGDCLILTWGEGSGHRIMIDGGRGSCWDYVRKHLKDRSEAERTFELLIVSHIDADHIAGVLKMLRDPKCNLVFKEVWFNAYHHLLEGEWEAFGAAQGEQLSDILATHKDRWNMRFGGKAVVVRDPANPPAFQIAGLDLTVLSPTPEKLAALALDWEEWIRNEQLKRGVPPAAEPAPAPMIPAGMEAFGSLPDVEALAKEGFVPDTEAPNGSAIAIQVEYGGKRILLLGDAHIEVLEAAALGLPADRRQADLVKLSHHGSRRNVSARLAELWNTTHYVISTNGSIHDHPDPQTVAVLLKASEGKKHFYFNYRHAEAVQWDDDGLRDRYHYTTRYASDGYLKIDLLTLVP